jgi:hypothetical protein
MLSAAAFMLAGSLGFWQARGDLGLWRAAPLAAALCPLPLALLAILHIEIPILLIGMAWPSLALGLHVRQSVVIHSVPGESPISSHP